MMEINDVSEGLYLEEYIKSAKDQEAQKLQNESLLLAYRKIIKDPDGRRVIWDILEECKVFHLSMTGNSWTYFNEGSRKIGLYIMSMLSLGNTLEDVEDGFKKVKPDDEPRISKGNCSKTRS